MADTEQEKTEAATPRRKQQAADEGRIPRSTELGAATILIAGAIALRSAGTSVGERSVSYFASSLRGVGEALDAGAAIAHLRSAGQAGLILVGTIGLMLTGAVFAVSVVQARGTLTSKPLMPQFSRLNPLENAKRVFSAQAIVELIKSLAKFALVGLVTWRVLTAAWPDLMELGGLDVSSVFETIRHYTARLLLTAGISYLVIAAADYGWQWWKHVRDLRMTKDEVRQESKQMDGDPLLKSRMRAIARARARRQMYKDVAKADVVIVNPTHIAIALRYDPMTAPAPFVLAMGERKVAERIKELAAKHGVPMMENRPLARALLGSARVGATIPAELYAAVAEILAFVYRQRAMRGDAPSWAGPQVLS